MTGQATDAKKEAEPDPEHALDIGSRNGSVRPARAFHLLERKKWENRSRGGEMNFAADVVMAAGRYTAGCRQQWVASSRPAP